MRDLLVITPSRGRPERLRVMIEACLSLSEADTDIAVGVDLDDPALPRYRELESERVCVIADERCSLARWTNDLAGRFRASYGAFASLGDDHLPRTQGWDRLLLEAAGRTGIAYGDDLHQGAALPTAPVITADIAAALGWVCEPSLKHFYVDHVWKDIAQAAGVLRYVPGVVTEHMHPHAGKGPRDQTYVEVGEGGPRWTADRHAYEDWRLQRMAADVAKVLAVMATSPVRGRA